MRFKIHYKLPNGDEDSLVIEGDSIEEIQTKVEREMDKRGAVDGWSEEMHKGLKDE